MNWDTGLTDAQKGEVLRMWDASERERVRREWEAEGRPEHDCDPLDTYAGGCSVCGNPQSEEATGGCHAAVSYREIQRDDLTDADVKALRDPVRQAFRENFGADPQQTIVHIEPVIAQRKGKG